ncbi:hypothetical protein SAMN06297144_1220 [Sphingomonas guangdongensis]|uniref:Peptidase U49 n=1 Tax=Sphingomonas guangdongensis TaxID=1141890 RepID=A0A285QH11_9SPHN|nr:hypothetical protein [Sphingomonas guangdongensis]SOB80754.1 hypothetical protein SAMN06297144_1220 [Sphingomonas guangdongensis]
MPTPLNDAAADLWSQIFERIAAHPGAAINDPEHDHAADDVVMRAGFAGAGWSEDEISGIVAAGKSAEEKAPSTSPGVSRAAEARHAILCGDVEAEMARQRLDSHALVARGIEPRTGPFASKIGVVMTEQSIIAVGSFTYRFCGLVAKAFTRTLRLEPGLWEPDDFTPARARTLLRRNPAVLIYWLRIHLSFALTGTNLTVPFKPSTKEEIVLVEQVARAMEIFIVAHEYGHHHFGHGRDVEADAHAEEFGADQFALRIGAPLGLQERFWNPYLESGAGGAILLMALETLRHFETFLGGRVPVADTHPVASARIDAFDTVALMEPRRFAALKGYRTASRRLMAVVHELMDEILAGIPVELRASLTRMRAELAAELP